jgi:hypothetical protein
MLTMATLRGVTVEPTSALQFSLDASPQSSKLSHGTASDLYSGDQWFKSQKGHRPCWPRFSMHFLSLFRQMPDSSSNWPCPLHSASFPIHYWPDYPTVDTTQSEMQTSLNKPQSSLGVWETLDRGSIPCNHYFHTECGLTQPPIGSWGKFPYW